MNAILLFLQRSGLVLISIWLTTGNAWTIDGWKEQLSQHIQTASLVLFFQKVELGAYGLLTTHPGSSALLLLLGILGGQYARVQRRFVQVRQQADKLELLIRESHHRVKNNMAMVIGMVNIHAYQPNSKETLQTLTQRLEAISLIHQRLYQTDLPTQVDMQAYLTELTQNLVQAYSLDPSGVELTFSIGVKWLNVDQAIPLGLIANELITNSLKYAFQQIDHQPALHIALTNDPTMLLEVADNGSGFNPTNWQRAGGSFGKQLIKALSAQLGGVYDLDTTAGTRFRLRLPELAKPTYSFSYNG